MGQRDSVTADPVSGQTTALLATFGRVWTQAEDQEALAAFDPVVLPGSLIKMRLFAISACPVLGRRL